MSDKKKTNKKKISTLIKQQVPEFVLSEHPKFTEFLTSYFLFLESAKITLKSFTEIDHIVLETEATANNFILFERTNAFGLDAGDKLVAEENDFAGSFRKGEVITGSTSGATSTVIAEDITANNCLFISANNGFITGETVTGSLSGATALVEKYRANPVENIQQLLNYSDPDHTISDFLSQMKETFLNSIPTDKDDAVSTRKLIKNIRSLYRAKGTAKAHEAFFRILFNETAEVYTPTDDVLRVSDGKFDKRTFIRCTQTALQSVNDPIFLTGQVITQANDPADTDVNEATAIVENVLKFQEGSTEIIEIIINDDTVSGTFVNGATITGTSNADPDTIIGVVVSQSLSDTVITNDGHTLTVGDEATISGGAGSGARVQVQDLSGGGVDEVIVNAAGQNFQEGDTLTFSSGTAEAEVSIVGGGFAPESGSLDIHIELESGTISGSGSGDLLLEDAVDNERGGKLLDSASPVQELRIRTALENESGGIISEESVGSNTIYIVNQESEPDRPYNMEATDHIRLEDKAAATGYNGNKLVQQNATGTGDITDIRMIASGSGYTSLPTATISGDRFIGLEDATSSETTDFSRVELEQGGRLANESSFSVLNVTGATVIPFGANIGRATSLQIIEHGIDFTSAPTLAFPKYAVLKSASGTISADETFTSNVSGATGSIISFDAPLLKYTATQSELEVGDTITTSGSQTAVVVKADTLSATATIGAKVTTAGAYINQDGHISENSKKIQDSLYYQDYSYVIRVSESINKWRDAIKRAVHPSGFYVTGEVNIQTRVSGQVKQPVGATLAAGLFSGTSDSPIYMRLNTLFSTIFGRRTGVGLKFMSNGIELDGKTKVSSAVARTGVAVEPQNDYRDTSTNTEKELNLHPETTIETEKRSRTNFYTNTDYKVRGYNVKAGFAYAGPRIKSLNTFMFSAFSANNAITLEGGTGAGEIILENEHGVLQHPQSDSFSARVNSFTNLRFGSTNTGTDKIIQEDGSNLISETAGTDTDDGVDEFLLEENVDGTTLRISDFTGTTTNPNHKTNLAFPTEVTKSA
tara:strand:- start:81 stop:3221 length:3141 start_codon:yes stop_codon:yes gene_type:complete